MGNPKSARNILIALLLFLGVSAVGGGSFLIISPSGKLIGGLPVSILEHSPFSNFLIPGIVLLLILGLAPCVISYALVKKPTNRLAERFNFFKDMYWAWSFSIYIAFALIIWIQVETIFVQGVGWLQTFYMLYSIPIILVALLPQVRIAFKK
jgi:magnesium-transporting ATPase (P-type)